MNRRHLIFWLIATAATATIFFVMRSKSEEAVAPLDRSAVQAKVATSDPVGRTMMQRPPEALGTVDAGLLLSGHKFKQRPPGEWQGMLVDLSARPECEETEHCGLARVCKAGVCTACDGDVDCAHGEVCVMDHCLVADRVACRRRADCGKDSQCILSGYSYDPRGNQSMDARCVAAMSGTTRRPPLPPAPVDSSHRELPYDDEFRRAQDLIGRTSH